MKRQFRPAGSESSPDSPPFNAGASLKRHVVRTGGYEYRNSPPFNAGASLKLE